MRKLTVYLLSMLFALSVPVFAMAHGPDGKDAGDHKSSCAQHMRRGGGRDGLRMAGRMPGFYLKHSSDLKLSDEQVASLKKITSALKKDMVTKGADVKVRELELSEILAGTDYKLDDATAKLKQVEDARLALESTVLQYSVQARDILTPDQLKGLKDICGHETCGKGMKRHMREGEEQK